MSRKWFRSFYKHWIQPWSPQGAIKHL